MSIRLDYLGEPRLQFGQYFEHEDTKTGLAEYGPFGKNIPGLHPSEIKLGFIGTRETISDAKEWIAECRFPIESQNIKVVGSRSVQYTGGLFPEDEPALHQRDRTITRLQKIINRDFVGFDRDTPFESCFQMNERWERSLHPVELSDILAIEDKVERIRWMVNLLDSEVESLATTGPSPDIIVLALTSEMVEKADAVRVSGSFFLNFRRAIKARTMRWGVPIQLLKRPTVLGTGNELQEKATRAWNFCTAQYYKAEGVPWRPAGLERDVCFIGISFFVAHAGEQQTALRASVAQAFDYLGQGLVLRGEPFEWREESFGRSPHLTRANARSLIHGVLSEYLKINRIPPKRVVVHKTSEFWGSDHGEFNEIDGLYEGIVDVFPRCESDLVALRQTGIRLFREGLYPPLRGTYVSIDDDQHFLFTMGFIPYLETCPAVYIPKPWQITQHHGGSSPKDLFREILALTKMNVNNCAFADGTPITLSFSQKIGEIMKHIPADGVVQPKYRFYM